MNSQIKKALGRGLSSLIGETKIESKTNKLSLSDIIPNKFQPRKTFSKESLEELTNSIKEQGIIQPIVVRPDKSDEKKYEIIAGERRWLASQNAGLNEVPVVILDVDDVKSLEFAIVENVQRQDLNPIEEARGYQKLIDDFNYNQEKLSKFIGKSRSYIANALRILTLPDDVIKLIETQKLTTGHAKILVGLENASFVASKILEKKLSVRQAENLVLLFKTLMFTSLLMNFRFLFLNRVPFNRPVSVNIWKPLHIPRIKHPLLANFITSSIIKDLPAIAPDLK